MSGSRRILVSRQSLETGRPASSLVPVDRGVHLPVDMCSAGMKRILASGDQKDSIGAEDRDFLSAMGTGPAAHPRAAVPQIAGLVDDEVACARLDDGLPGGVGTILHVLETLCPQTVVAGRTAAVAVDKGPPMGNRVEHVSSFVRDLTKRQLDQG